MRKSALLVLGLIAITLFASPVFAAEATAETTVAAEAPVTTETPAPAAEPAPAEPAADPIAATEAVIPVEQEPQPTDNLEFVSGEISALDEAAKTVTVKLYGEAEGEAEKILTVKVDETTDITDGEKDRDIKSLAVGTEVDVEFDPATNKSTYIFVY